MHFFWIGRSPSLKADIFSCMKLDIKQHRLDWCSERLFGICQGRGTVMLRLAGSMTWVKTRR